MFVQYNKPMILKGFKKIKKVEAAVDIFTFKEFLCDKELALYSLGQRYNKPSKQVDCWWCLPEGVQEDIKLAPSRRSSRWTVFLLPY